MNGINDLIVFLKPSVIINHRRKWEEMMLNAPIQIEEFDKYNGVVKYVQQIQDEEGNVETSLGEHSHDLDWRNDLSLILNKVENEINALKYASDLSTEGVNSNIKRLIEKLRGKVEVLKSTLPFSLTLGTRKLISFIEALEKEIVPIAKTRRKRKMALEGFRLNSTIKNQEAFIEQLFVWLVSKKMFQESERTLFRDFLQQTWQEGNKLHWMGTRIEYIDFRHCLFNKFKYGEKTYKVVEHRSNAPTEVLNYFSIEGYSEITAKELRALRTNPTNDAFYKQLRAKILDLLD